MFVNAWIALGLFLFLMVAIRFLLDTQFLRRILGFALLGHALNLMLLLSGVTGAQRNVIGTPAFVQAGRFELIVDPLPQALILTAIVIGFAVTAVLLIFEIVEKE